eukprot:11329-Pelagococcus_subviridis.AAC.1
MKPLNGVPSDDESDSGTTAPGTFTPGRPSAIANPPSPSRFGCGGSPCTTPACSHEPAMDLYASTSRGVV